jgi:5-formyltetrahydrofolate cyclo-ligase
MLKKELRSEYLEKRSSLDNDTVRELHENIVDRFAELRLPAIHYLLSYYPVTTQNEFDVTACEEVVRAKNPSLKVAWPKIGVDLATMEARLVERERMFVKNRFNILEPLDGEFIEPVRIDLIFVPLIAVDKRGFRVGYGKGYYDRFLQLCRPDAMKIGFSYFEPVDSVEDIHQFDVPLTLCISPSRVYEF